MSLGDVALNVFAPGAIIDSLQKQDILGFSTQKCTKSIPKVYRSQIPESLPAHKSDNDAGSQ